MRENIDKIKYRNKKSATCEEPAMNHHVVEQNKSTKWNVACDYVVMATDTCISSQSAHTCEHARNSTYVLM